VGLANGWVQELPRVFLDPRRPVVAAATPEMREEGVMPYLPELPIQPEAIINYNQTVQSVRGIYTANSALESTGLVFVYGLGQLFFFPFF
jgi:ER membrane protein complex subunit 1